MKEDIIICRCEEITHDDVVKAIKEGYTTLDEIKRHLKCGVGPCQGRTCMRLIARILSKELKKPITEIKFPKVRPPIRPVPIGILAEDE